MFERFTVAARTVVSDAKAKATARGDEHIGSLHLLSALMTGDSVAARALADQGVNAAAVERLLGPALRHGPAADEADAEALRTIGIELEQIRRTVEARFGAGALSRATAARRGSPGWTGRSPLTDDAKRALAESLKEARSLRHDYIGTEHLLLGLLRAADHRPRGRLKSTLGHLGLDYPTTRGLILSYHRPGPA